MQDFSGKVAFVTGGDKGMGLVTARQLAARGAHVAIFSRQPGEAAEQEIRTACRSPAQQVMRFALDVANRDNVLEIMARAQRAMRAPDLVICMAGIGATRRFVDMPFEVFDRMLQVNLYGTRHVIEAVLPGMIARGRGTLVPVASLGGFVPVYGYTAYGTSKFAVLGLAQCLRYELAPLGIEVCCFCPGQVATPGLAAEAQTLLPAAGALKLAGGTLPVEPAIRGLLRGIERGRPVIIPGARANLVYWLWRLTPIRLWNAITDAIVRVALRPASPSADGGAGPGPR
ncbi:MAG TPA: SDR family NAD(P)-dependent oxidoreductase [Pseudomonadales bacterium]|jgi:3-dehydrosphinganine reductase|nr:SDR family NAD(P)-dependent oxidoreductase [Pseudomonadales bacterium]